MHSTETESGSETGTHPHRSKKKKMRSKIINLNFFFDFGRVRFVELFSSGMIEVRLRARAGTIVQWAFLCAVCTKQMSALELYS